MSELQHNLQREFMNRTGSTQDQAQKILESNNWELEKAISHFQSNSETLQPKSENQSDGEPLSEKELLHDILKQAAKGKAELEKKSYMGVGYTLNSTPPKNETVSRTLILWRNGFSVDDGPLYDYTNPENQKMLAAIRSGRAPLSLLGVHHGQPVDVKVIKRRNKDYVQQGKVFEGKGYRLGSPLTYSSPLLKNASSTNGDKK